MRQKIQSYEIIEIIGHGGMGIVYKARHEFRKEIVAIKTLHPQYALDPELRKRFRNEAFILNNLDHPNIVKVLDFIEEPDSLNIVMEYVDGRTLDKMIGEEVGPIPYEKALILFEQILLGVSYAHQNGVIHRDLKPGNINVTKDNKVKITDFGIAKVEGGGSHTKTGTKMGTLYYMSPEQIRGEQVDERSDIYSLGITLYEMLAGRLPFERREGASDFAIMNQIVNEDIKDPREYYPYIPGELIRVIYKAISKEKEKRISSVINFIDEIEVVKEEIKLAEEEKKPKRILYGSLEKDSSYKIQANSDTPGEPVKPRTPGQANQRYVIPPGQEHLNAPQSIQPNNRRRRSGRKLAALISAGLVVLVIVVLSIIDQIQKEESRLQKETLPQQQFNTYQQPIQKDSDQSVPSVKKEVKLKPVEVKKEVEDVRVPDLTGMQLEAAKSIVRLNSLKIGMVSKIPRPGQVDQIIRQIPQAGAIVKKGSTVNLFVGVE